MDRRSFLRALAAGAAAITASPLLLANQADWRVGVLMKGERVLHLHRRSSKETFSVRYWHPKTGWDAQGYRAACHLLRDVTYKQAYWMDTDLLDTLYLMQSWLAAYGKNHQIHVLSGYRTPSHNSALEGAARNSLHVQGKAADILVPGIETSLLNAMGKQIAVGGVGFYPSKGFVHVDSGRVRAWRG